MTDQNNTEAMAAHIQAAEPHDARQMRGGYIALAEGYQIKDLEEFQAKPRRVTTLHNFRDTRSLATYLNRFQLPQTMLFSAPATRKISAIIDYHEAPGVPSHCDHRAFFTAQFTSRYEAWRSMHGKRISQVDAGLFLEERAVDVTAPEPATIMDMVMTFDAVKKVNFRSAQRLHDGQRQFSYVEENEVRGAITLPDHIEIKVPVFEGMEPDVVRVRMKYRITDGSLQFTFEIHERDEIERTAFERCEDALLSDMKSPLPILREV